MGNMDGEAEFEESATKLFGLAGAGGTEALPAHVGAAVPVGLTNGKGDTLLMPAAYYGHAETVRMLVTSGADPDRANDRGHTPLDGAVFKKESAVVRALLDAGADPDGGRPSAVETARMFANDQFIQWFEQRDS
ncbi:ankyrin repeat domain-containing protein [Nonomuraea gerenzanensis]|uniref:Putative ankyrin-like protein n=1 Tax=Nonomuraea gerenzanensis TaxID=93944 RepID=A0A1M4EK61_9ACTN|nr:ankyrin repeat domain-containing protein [Nonomuraea gerenzanensis]UBU10835.1 ankyrin repeat domain-containing protein [Nonomuraea gerenzanensis]SBO99269.1 putative ankyrin-like protein [Nonomuraea gerenzanensis]